MKKAIWLSLAISIVLVNLAAWLVEQFSGFHIEMLFRVALILGISVITAIFAGSYLLVNSFEQEKPLTGSTADTLQDSVTSNPDLDRSEKHE